MMDTKSLVTGIIAALVIGYLVHVAGLDSLIALPLGGAAGALMTHREDSQTAAAVFIVAAVLFLLPLDFAAPAALALTGYAIGRHT